MDFTDVWFPLSLFETLSMVVLASQFLTAEVNPTDSTVFHQ